MFLSKWCLFNGAQRAVETLHHVPSHYSLALTAPAISVDLGFLRLRDRFSNLEQDWQTPGIRFCSTNKDSPLLSQVLVLCLRFAGGVEEPNLNLRT